MYLIYIEDSLIESIFIDNNDLKADTPEFIQIIYHTQMFQDHAHKLRKGLSDARTMQQNSLRQLNAQISEANDELVHLDVLIQQFQIKRLEVSKRLDDLQLSKQKLVEELI